MLRLMVVYERLIEILHHNLKKINLRTFLWGIWSKKSSLCITIRVPLAVVISGSSGHVFWFILLFFLQMEFQDGCWSALTVHNL